MTEQERPKLAADELRRTNRRHAIALGAVGLAGLGVGYLSRTPELGSATGGLQRLRGQQVAFGGGLSLLGPMKDPAGNEQVMLRSIFSFSRQWVICSVEDNPEPFIFPTNAFGEVELPAHGFFMFMGSSKVSKVEFGLQDSKLKATITGDLDCNTLAATAESKFGGRESREPAGFIAEAVDGQSFAVTAVFDPDKAPVNHAIFGPRFTFAGQLVDSVVVVREVGNLAGA